MADIYQIIENNGTPKNIEDRKARTNIAPYFNVNNANAAGDLILSDTGTLFKFNAAYSAGTSWNSRTSKEQVNIDDELKNRINQINSDISTINSNINAIDSSLAIVSDGDVHIAISSGEYVYVKNHGTLVEGLYTANSAIGANVALTTSNLTSVDNKGGLNKLNAKSIVRVADIAISGTQITIQANQVRVMNVYAPSVSGYSFVGWIGTASDGWLGYVYPENYLASPTTFWVPGDLVNSTRKVNIYALYKKTAN